MDRFAFIRFGLIFLTGAALSWIITADHYGRIVTNSPGAGFMCRVYGMNTIRAGYWGNQETVCADLSYATPEADLWADFELRLHRMWSMPQ